jgi:hypothetical protein
MELERELRDLDVEWPQTPELRLVLGEQPRRRSRRPLYAAVALALVALAAAFAVPQSRGAILRFLHLGGETIEFVDTLPPAQERPLDTNLGIPVPLGEALLRVPRLLLPQLEPRPQLHAAGPVVSLVFLAHGHEVLLSELSTPGQNGGFLKKLASGNTKVEWVQVAGNAYGVWLSGAPHVFFFPREPARLAGDTLVWVQAETTYRLEGPNLSKDEALELARSLRYPRKG